MTFDFLHSVPRTGTAGWIRRCAGALLRVSCVALAFVGMSGCGRPAPLPAGYTIFTASSQEVGLSGGRYGSIVAGPKVTQIGSAGTLIFGEIALRPDRPASESDTLGFFLLDTTTEAIQKGLTREELLTRLREAGVQGEPDLRRP